MVQGYEDYYDNPNVPGDTTINPAEQWVTESGVPLTPEQIGQLEALAAAEVDETAEEEQVLPEELMVTDQLQLIPIAIAQSRLLQIMYQNRKGETKLYVVEPYEIGGSQSHPAGYLWAFDRNAATIKSFFLSNLLDVQLMTETFVPRV